MILDVDLGSDVAIHQQLYDRVVEAIADGRLAAGDRLPSTRQLAADFGINFHTVNKAYDRLRRQGFVRLNRRTGAEVARDGRSAPAGDFVGDWERRVRPLLAEAAAHGVAPADVLARCAAVLDSFRPAGGDHP
jgi:GntR family transcriptional regulator